MERKFYLQVGEENANIVQEPDAKEEKRFWRKVSERRDHNKEAEWINSMEKKFQSVEESPQPSKILNWKRPRLYGIKGFRFKKFTSIYNKLVIEMNRYLLYTDLLELMTKEENQP